MKNNTLIFNKLSQTDNLCISPLSINLCLALAYIGSKEETKSELEGFGISQEFIDLIPTLLSALRKDTPDEKVTIANQVNISQSITAKEAYLNNLENIFGLKPNKRNFLSASTVTEINKWAAEITNNRISEIIPPNYFNANTLLLLVNAIYIKLAWVKAFSKVNQEKFFVAEKPIQVPTLVREGYYRVLEDKNRIAAAIELHAGFEVVCIQKEGFLTEGDIEATRYMPSSEVKLYLPSFKFKSPSIQLADILINLGIQKAFDNPPGTANFSGICDDQPIRLDAVFHKTFVELNKDGIEAAAVTAIGLFRSCVSFQKLDVKEIRFDKPFFYIIRHIETGTVLFVGKVVDPTKE